MGLKPRDWQPPTAVPHANSVRSKFIGFIDNNNIIIKLGIKLCPKCSWWPQTYKSSLLGEKQNKSDMLLQHPTQSLVLLLFYTTRNTTGQTLFENQKQRWGLSWIFERKQFKKSQKIYTARQTFGCALHYDEKVCSNFQLVDLYKYRVFF